MATGKENQLLPKTYYDRGEADPRYPTTWAAEDVLGRLEIVSANPEDPEKGFRFVLDHHGGFKYEQNNPDKDRTGLSSALTPGEKRSYVNGGSSAYSGGNLDATTLESSQVRTAKVDQGKSSGGDSYNGAGGQTMGGSQGSAYTHHVKGDKFVTSEGQVVSHHVGNLNNDLEGDTVESVSGNKHLIVAKGAGTTESGATGEYGIHIQDGNMDTTVDTGQYKVLTKGNTLTLESYQKIVFKVGSSVITMEPGQITVEAAAVKFKKA